MNLSDKIKNQIKNKKPNPKWQYTIINIIQDIILVLLWIIIVIGLGMLIYVLINYNPWDQMPKTFRYFWQGFIGLPWELMIILGLLIFFTYYLFKNVHFIYRLNRWMIVGLILISLIGGYVIAERIGINKKVATSAPVKKLYQRQGRLIRFRRGTIIVGIITKISADDLQVRDTNENIWKIKISKNTRFPQGSKFFSGELVRINGIKNNNSIKAIIMRPLGVKLRGLKNVLK